MTAVVTRFAPSPTGYLHLGHACSALFAEASARQAHGRFLLRIEDIDRTRCRPEFTAAALEDLAWLGLAWEEPVRRQSEHFGDYARALERLRGDGLLYPCFCTRRQVQEEVARSPGAPHGPEGALYPGTCRDLPPSERHRRSAAGESYALRLDAAAAARLLAGRCGQPLHWVEDGLGAVAVDPLLSGDVVLARKEMPASYHLAVVVDDALQRVSLVTRGEDLRPATHVHRLLQAVLALPAPRYRHHPLLTGADGRRLAKRTGATALRDLRAAGLSPEDVRRRCGEAGLWDWRRPRL